MPGPASSTTTSSSNAPPPEESQPQLTPAHLRALLQELDVSVEEGLSTREASARRHLYGVNQVDPPIQCPGWICCLLPCIKSIPSQKQFLAMQPEDAEVKRNGQWIRYDASSLVKSDIIRLEEGDVVPADCTVLWTEPTHHNNDDDGNEFLVDHGPVTGDTKKPETHPAELYWGGRVLVGSCVAVVTAVGNATRVGQLIQAGSFPVQQPQQHSQNSGSSSCSVIQQDRDDEEGGIALLSRDKNGKEDAMV